jgi:hypothetical protein
MASLGTLARAVFSASAFDTFASFIKAASSVGAARATLENENAVMTASQLSEMLVFFMQLWTTVNSDLFGCLASRWIGAFAAWLKGN